MNILTTQNMPTAQNMQQMNDTDNFNNSLSVAQISEIPSKQTISRPSDAEQSNEYDYILAEHLTKRLLEKGFISAEEYNRIMVKNREIFKPLFSRI